MLPMLPRMGANVTKVTSKMPFGEVTLVNVTPDEPNVTNVTSKEAILWGVTSVTPPNVTNVTRKAASLRGNIGNTEERYQCDLQRDHFRR